MIDYETTYSRYLTLVEDYLRNTLSGIGTSSLHESMRYSLFAGGKRIRPVLTLAWCELCGGDPKSALPAACAMEMIHTYTLIHDDLPCMDNDSLRRGKPSNHMVFGEYTALLAGSGLFNKAFETVLNSFLSDNSKIEIMNILCSACGERGVLLGQQLDMEPKDSVSFEELDRLNLLKTSALLSAACQIGVICAGGSAEQRQSAVRFGNAFGLAFQIRDDLLDVIGDQNAVGKTLRKDASEDKKNYVTILGVVESQNQVNRLSSEAMKSLSDYSENGFLAEMIQRMQSRAY